MGNNKQGLQLLIEKIGDVKQVDSPTLGVTLKAIEFIETQNDDELWDDLIDYSMKHPKFVSDLLEHIGAYVDPVLFGDCISMTYLGEINRKNSWRNGNSRTKRKACKNYLRL